MAIAQKTLYGVHKLFPNHFRIAFLTVLLLGISFATVSYEERKTFDRELLSVRLRVQQDSVAVLSASTDNQLESTVAPSEQIHVLAIGEKKELPTPIPPVSWGKSKQIDDHTWTITVGKDGQNANADQILAALNIYRSQHGSRTLAKDDRLMQFAASRAGQFDHDGKLDGHQGFQAYISNDGFNKLGFHGLGENSSYGYELEATHLIEWVYAGDKPHDDNQLNSNWTHVGIGVSGKATDLVFGSK